MVRYPSTWQMTHLILGELGIMHILVARISMGSRLDSRISSEKRLLTYLVPMLLHASFGPSREGLVRSRGYSSVGYTNGRVSRAYAPTNQRESGQQNDAPSLYHSNCSRHLSWPSIAAPRPATMACSCDSSWAHVGKLSSPVDPDRARPWSMIDWDRSSGEQQRRRPRGRPLFVYYLLDQHPKLSSALSIPSSAVVGDEEGQSQRQDETVGVEVR